MLTEQQYEALKGVLEDYEEQQAPLVKYTLPIGPWYLTFSQVGNNPSTPKCCEQGRERAN